MTADIADSSPPRPRLVVRIGVTGHRPHQLGDGSEATHAGALRRILEDVVRIAAAIHHDNRDVFDHQSPRLRLVTALAEGADRIAAGAALASGYELICPLPFARDEYAHDFKDDASLREFDGYLAYARSVLELDGRRGDAEDRAYETASLVTLAHSDIVVALWDGQPSKGRGGTADTIRHAVESGLPVIWFDEYGQGPRLLFAGGASRISDPGDLARIAEPLTDERLAALLTETFAPLARNTSGAEGEARRRLKHFLSEDERRTNLWLWYPLLIRALGGRRLRMTDLRPQPYLDAIEAEWADYRKVVAPLEERTPTGIGTIVAPRYAWADKLSVYFGQAYRGSYISNFTLSAATVCLSLLSVFSLIAAGKPLFVITELVLVAAILINSSLGARRNWHERWLDYRQLAEQLRHMRMLIFTGVPLFDAAKAHARDAEPGPTWIDWYTRATARELVPPSRRVDADYLRVTAAVIAAIEVEPQRDWHRGNARTMERVAHRLHTAGTSLFFVTGCITLGELIVFAIHWFHFWDGIHYVEEPYAQAATFFGAVLPALGASISGIRVQADFEDVSERSHGMARHLDGIAKSLRGRDDPDFAFVSNVAEAAAETMLADIADWRFVFRGKSLTLPS